MWILFCIFDIVHHRRKLNINTVTIKKLDAHPVPIKGGHLYLSGNKHIPLANEETHQPPSTPYFNLQLFDDSDDFHSDDNDNLNNNERHETSSSKPTHEDEDEDHTHGSLPHARSKSQSSDNLSTKSSLIIRKHVDTTRDVLTRRHALDPGAAHNLRTYVRHRKDSIVQRVIGYNYDDHSTAGGLYIRVGIGSKTKTIKLIRLRRLFI